MKTHSMFYILVLLITLSCSKQTQDTKLIDSLKNEYLGRISYLSYKIDSLEYDNYNLRIFNIQNYKGILLIKVINDKYLNWDNCSYEIVKDKYWLELKKDYLLNKVEYIELIEDTNSTKANICGLTKNLTKGDFAFLIIDEVENIPYSTVFRSQWDVLHMNCKYPDGLFSSLNENRNFFKTKLLDYLIK